MAAQIPGPDGGILGLKTLSQFRSDPLNFLQNLSRDYGDVIHFKFAYLPFGGGPRICVGNHMAMMEAEILLAMMVKRYQFELVTQGEVALKPLFTLHPRDGLHLRIKKHTSLPSA